LLCTKAPVAVRVQTEPLLEANNARSEPALIAGGGEATLLWATRDELGGSTFAATIDKTLAIGTAATIGGPDARVFHSGHAGCYEPAGPVSAWSKRKQYDELSTGVILDLADVVVRWPDGTTFEPHAETIGSATGPAVACLSGGRSAVTWSNQCYGVENIGSALLIYRPDECDAEPADGSYLQMFESDGTPVSSEMLVSPFVLYQAAHVAAIEDNHFAMVVGSRIELRDADGALLGSTDFPQNVESTYGAELVCAGSRCAAATSDTITLFDMDGLNAVTSFEVDASIAFGADRRVFPDDADLACDENGLCLAVWVRMEAIHDYDTIQTTVIGMFARPFDLVTGKTGDEIRLNTTDAGWMSGGQVVSTGPGVFLVVGGYEGYYFNNLTVSRVEVSK
jgi:hypothetical protein